MPTPLIYRLLADAILVIHVGFVAFVVFGLALILLGGALRWRWVRNRWFRWIHLAGIAIVVFQAWFGIVCPLTTLENFWRAKSGDATYSGSFIEHWLHAILFYDGPSWVFTTIYTVFGALVLASWFLIRPLGAALK